MIPEERLAAARAELEGENSALAGAVAAETAALEALRGAKDALRADPSPELAEAAAQRQAEVARAALMVEARQGRVEAARQGVAAADRALALQQIERLRERCAAFTANVAPSIRRLVALAADAYAVSEAIIAEVDVHEEARAAIGAAVARTDLHVAEVMPPARSLELALALAQAAVQRDREDEGRRFLEGLEPHHWIAAATPPRPTDEGVAATTHRAALALLEEMNHE